MTKTITSDKFACVLARILDDKLAKNIAVLNISQVSSLADYFVICSADSTTQVKALTNILKEKVKILFQRFPYRLFQSRTVNGTTAQYLRSSPVLGSYRLRL